MLYLSLLHLLGTLYSSLGETYCSGSYECGYNDMTGTTILCDGYYGCQGGTFEFSAAFCDGSYGCTESELTLTDEGFCSGSYGCYDATIEADSSIYCDGSSACYGSTVVADEYAYCSGAYGCLDATITSVSDTYCTGYYACQDASITSTSGLICSGPNSCFLIDGIINGDLSCDGYYACYLSEIFINSDASIYVYGPYGAAESTLEITDNIGNIFITASGEYAYDGATIQSGESNALTIIFRGWYSLTSTTTITCEDGAVCTIYCFGYACDPDAFIDCDEGLCEIDCTDAATDMCPTVSASKITKLSKDTKKDIKSKIEAISSLNKDTFVAPVAPSKTQESKDSPMIKHKLISDKKSKLTQHMYELDLNNYEKVSSKIKKLNNIKKINKNNKNNIKKKINKKNIKKNANHHTSSIIIIVLIMCTFSGLIGYYLGIKTTNKNDNYISNYNNKHETDRGGYQPIDFRPTVF